MSAPGLETTTRTGTELDIAVEVFLAHRTRLFRVAYRVTGDVSSAEDVVQEAWLRWQRTDRSTVKNPAAFLTTATTRLAINVIQSARHRHETPAEAPLADLVDPAFDPTRRAEQTAEVEETLALLMSRLTSGELAAYLLRKGFDYAYGDVARLLRTSIPNARQLVRRAQTRIDGDRDRPVDPDLHQHLVTAFLTASRSGHLEALEQVLTRDVEPATCSRTVRPRQRTDRSRAA
ncbi:MULTISPECIES: sigma factor [unclassified Nocardioides]|jgi:RNA polymerase sigma factor (sigma-70 family)|uniref:sigma factor n=1 Tax=Nocardioides sp. URHA0032 TaxID=1380388 RepID=UPI0009DD0284|nr:sigma factor [Nocardioides sp. URHA0032]